MLRLELTVGNWGQPTAAPAEPEYTYDDPDPPDLFARWLAHSEWYLGQPDVTGTQLEACRIGIRPWERLGNVEAVRMMKRLDEAEERAVSFKPSCNPKS